MRPTIIRELCKFYYSEDQLPKSFESLSEFGAEFEFVGTRGIIIIPESVCFKLEKFSARKSASDSKLLVRGVYCSAPQKVPTFS